MNPLNRQFETLTIKVQSTHRLLRMRGQNDLDDVITCDVAKRINKRTNLTRSNFGMTTTEVHHFPWETISDNKTFFRPK